VLVDVTAEETVDLLQSALGHGFDLVLANKKPLAGTPESYDKLLQTAQTTGRRIRYEATVGAGLPILDTFWKLVDSGDRVLRLEGCVSGTLGFVFTAVSQGKPFSEAVREAFKTALKKLGLNKTIRANKAGCLDQCEHGVTVVVYPEQVWYGFVTVADVPEIVEQHLVGGQPVTVIR
jgi:(2Fe-2S) ferredoxin